MNERFPSPEEQYPRFVYDEEGNLVKEEESEARRSNEEEDIEKHEAHEEKREEREENAKENNEPNDEGLADPGRRAFLKKAIDVTGNALTAAAVGPVMYGVSSEEEEKQQPNKTRKAPEADTESQIENKAAGMDIFEQLRQFERIVDMDAAVAAEYEDEYTKLAETADGQARVRGIVERYKKHDIDDQPYQKMQLAPWLSFALPAHESDWLNRTSKSGAIGTHQFMPGTIKAMGYTEADALDPVKANVMTAEYLADERRRFGDDLYMQLHAYNAGAGLNGFTQEVSDQSKWTREELYAYIADRLNETYKELNAEGFVFSNEPAFEEYTIKPGDTMWSISKWYDVDMGSICETNGIEDPAVIHVGDTLRIPYKNELEKELRQRNSNTLQMLEYAPRVVAMQDAAASLGYVAAREAKDDPVKLASSE